MKIVNKIILLVSLIVIGIILSISFNKPSITSGSVLINGKMTVFCIINKESVTNPETCCKTIEDIKCNKLDGKAIINFNNGIYKAEYVCFNKNKIYFDDNTKNYCEIHEYKLIIS